MQTRMKLGTVTFLANPSIYTPPELLIPVKRIATVITFESVAVFNWGTTIVGKECPLEWKYLERTQLEQFKALFLANEPLTFDPASEDGKTYQVELLSLIGKNLYKLNNLGGDLWFRDVKLNMLILKEL